MSARVGWPDVAKGICIILVVLWHVVTKHAVGMPGAGAVTGVWATLGAQLLPLRMPLFFLISGMFAARAVLDADDWAWRRRAGTLAMLYVVWVLIQTAALALAPGFDTARAENGWELLAQLTISPTNLWYLLALAAYLVIARVTRDVPSAIVLPVAFALAALAAAGVLPDLGNLWQVAQNLFFFLAGLRLRDAVERFAAASDVRRAVGLSALYVVAAAVVGVLGMRRWPGMGPLLAVLAVLAGIAVCVVIDRRVGPLARALRWIGRRTLPIYVLHMIPLALLDRALQTAGWRDGPIVEAAGPVVLTAVVIAACLGAHALLVRGGLGALFDPMRVVDRAREQVAARSRGGARGDRPPSP